MTIKKSFEQFRLEKTSALVSGNKPGLSFISDKFKKDHLSLGHKRDTTSYLTSERRFQTHVNQSTILSGMDERRAKDEVKNWLQQMKEEWFEFNEETSKWNEVNGVKTVVSSRHRYNLLTCNRDTVRIRRGGRINKRAKNSDRDNIAKESKQQFIKVACRFDVSTGVTQVFHADY